MKTNKMTAALIILLLAASPLQANQHMTVDEKVQKLKKELDLNDDQAAKVRPVIEDFKAKMENLYEEKENKLNGILTPEQMNKYREWKDKKDKK